jgi:hypothetical protein
MARLSGGAIICPVYSPNVRRENSNRLPYGDFTTAVDNMQQRGVELAMGSEAKELLYKMDQVKGIAPQPENGNRTNGLSSRV